MLILNNNTWSAQQAQNQNLNTSNVDIKPQENNMMLHFTLHLNTSNVDIKHALLLLATD